MHELSYLAKWKCLVFAMVATELDPLVVVQNGAARIHRRIAIEAEGHRIVSR